MHLQFTSDWFTHNIPNIEKYCNHKFNSCLEIGTHEGRSACYWINNIINEGGSITVIDPWENEHGYFSFLNNINLTITNNISVNIKIGKSVDILPSLESNSFDFIYVDGDHTAECVYNDLIMSYKLCTEGGFILCDDYLLHEVFPSLYNNIEKDYPYNGINKFIENYKDKIEVIFKDYQMLLRKL